MHIIRIRIIGNLETTLAVCRKQRQRLEVDIAHYAVVSHHIIELVTVFCVFADKSYKVKVTAAAVVFIAVIKHLNRQILKFFVVKLYKLMSALKHLIVAFKLSHTDCGKHIEVFGKSRVEEVAAQYGVPVLAKLPIDPKLAEAVDAGCIEDAKLPESLQGATAMLEKLL